MAYSYVSARVRLTRFSATWDSADLSNVTIATILATYYDVSIALTNPFLPGTAYLSKQALQAQSPRIFPSTQTLSAWLASLGNQSLQLATTQPPMTPKSVRFSDAWQAGFSIEPASIARNPNTQAAAGSLPDLLLTKDGIDPASMVNYMLVSVNGYMHRCVGSVNGIYVLGGGVTHRLANQNYCGIFSFLPVGKVQQIPITPAMVHKPNNRQMYSESAYISVPVSLKNKVVLLSLGGYLHVLDQMYDKVSDSLIKINTRLIQMPQRLYQSVGTLDLSSLPLQSASNDSMRWNVSSLFSDAVMLNYLTLPQSFLIVVDTPTWYTQRYALERSCIPGRYFSGLGRRLPLLGPLGKLFEYRLSQEEDTYVYGCDSMHDVQYNFETTDWLEDHFVGPHRYSARPWFPGQGQLLDMGTFVA